MKRLKRTILFIIFTAFVMIPMSIYADEDVINGSENDAVITLESENTKNGNIDGQESFENLDSQDINNVEALEGAKLEETNLIDANSNQNMITEGDLSNESKGAADDKIEENIVKPAVTAKLNTEDHIKYMNGNSDGLFHPDEALTRAETAQVINSLITYATDADIIQNITFSDVDSSEWYAYPIQRLASYGVMSGSEGRFRPTSEISRAEFVKVLSNFYELSGSDKSFTDLAENHWAYNVVLSAAEKGWISGYADGTFHPDATISRVEAVTMINRVLGRNSDEITINSAAGIRIFPDLEKWHWAYNDVMEATIAHQYIKNESSETWTSFTKEKTVLSTGIHLINGTLYRVDSETGDFITNRYVDGHWYDATGKYITGNTTLDSLMRSATRACVTSNMTQHQMLKSAFNYVVNNFSYLSKAKQSVGTTGWTENYAVSMFQTHKGNCYSFAAVYYYLAKNIGYNPTEVAGLVGYNRRPHGWVEISINGKKYIYDTELTMAKRLAGYSYYLFEMTYSNAPFIYAKK